MNIEDTTYDEYIQNIIDTRGQWNIPDGEYFEMHHILPRCLGGSGDKEDGSFIRRSNNQNCIWLYANEHYIAHALLSRKYPDNSSLAYAFNCMATYKSSLQCRDQIDYNSVQYKDIVENFRNINKYQISIQSKNSKWYTDGTNEIFIQGDPPDGYTPGRSDKYKQKMKLIEFSEQHCKNLSKSLSGKGLGKKWYNDGVNESLFYEESVPDGWVKGRLKFSDQARFNMSRAQSGENNSMYGKHRDEHSRMQQGQSRKGLKCYTDGVITVMRHQCPQGFTIGRAKKDKFI